MLAAPSSRIASFQTVSVVCAKCDLRLFRYKKKNGTKSNLVKCYVERIHEDSAGVLRAAPDDAHTELGHEWSCPQCNGPFARTALIHGKHALKMIGGKVAMRKK